MIGIFFQKLVCIYIFVSIFVSCVAGDLPPLCHRAHSILTYLSSRYSHWRNGQYSNILLVLKYRHWVVACCRRRFSVLYITSGELLIYTANWEGLECTDRLQVVLPPRETAQGFSMGMSRKYIYIGIFNITHLFINLDGHYVFYKSLAILHDDTLIMTDENEEDFVYSNIQYDFVLVGRVLADDTLWLTPTAGHKFIIDLKTLSWFETKILASTKYLHTSNCVLHFAQYGTTVTLTDTTGKTTLNTFTAPQREKIVYSNKVIFIFAYPKYCLRGHYSVSSYYIRENGGKFLRTIEVPERSRLTLDPTKEILYLLTTNPELYRVKCINLTTGECEWTYEQKDGSPTYYGSFLMVVNEKYLMVYPGPSSDDLFALFTLDGRLIYEQPFTYGTMIHLSDDMVVSKDEGRLCIWKYF